MNFNSSAFLAELTTADWHGRLEALTRLQRHLDSHATSRAARTLQEPLLALVEDESWKVRHALVGILATGRGLSGALAALATLAQDSNHFVQNSAQRAQRQLTAARANRWRRTTGEHDAVFRAIQKEAHRFGAGALSERVLYEAAERITGVTYRTVVADVTHELNTVLRAVDGSARLLVDHLDKTDQLDPTVTRLLKRISDRSTMAHRIVADLRCYAAESSERWAVIPLDILVHQASDIAWEAAVNQNALPEVLWQLTPTAVPVLPNRMLRALGNLICNAIEATPPDGQLTIMTQVHPEEVVISIRDTGCGMSDDDQLAALRCFTSKKRGRGGTGMGLPIAQRVIEGEHHGRLEIDSEPGKGTTVRVMLPRQQEGSES